MRERRILQRESLGTLVQWYPIKAFMILWLEIQKVLSDPWNTGFIFRYGSWHLGDKSQLSAHRESCSRTLCCQWHSRTRCCSHSGVKRFAEKRRGADSVNSASCPRASKTLSGFQNVYGPSGSFMIIWWWKVKLWHFWSVWSATLLQLEKFLLLALCFYHLNCLLFVSLDLHT